MWSAMFGGLDSSAWWLVLSVLAVYLFLRRLRFFLSLARRVLSNG